MLKNFVQKLIFASMCNVTPAVSAWPPLELPTPLSEAVLLLDSQLLSLSKSRILKTQG